MRIHRQAGETPAADRERTRQIVDRVRRTGTPALRVWTPPEHVNFGRRDAASDGYAHAVEIATDRGYPIVEREAGGRAVVHTGATLAVARFALIESERENIRSRYASFSATLADALVDRGIDVEPGEPANSFCPGSHSLQTADGKVAGIAQRVRSDVAVISAILVVDEAAVADVLAPIYDALDVSFDQTSVGSLAATGGETKQERIAGLIVSTFREVEDAR